MKKLILNVQIYVARYLFQAIEIVKRKINLRDLFVLHVNQDVGNFIIIQQITTLVLLLAVLAVNVKNIAAKYAEVVVVIVVKIWRI